MPTGSATIRLTRSTEGIAVVRRKGTGEGTVYADHGRGEYVAEWTNREGKRLRQRGFPLTKAGLRDANRHLAAWKTDAGRNLRVGNRSTVADLFEDWLNDRIRPHREPKTIAYYEYLIRDHLNPALGARRVQELTVEDVQQLVNRLTERGLAPSTVRGARGCLRTALNHAVARRLVAVNVAATGIALPAQPHEPVEALTADEVATVLAATAGHRLHALYAVALATGARVGELIALRWEDVDWTAGAVLLRRQAQRLAGQTIVKAPKQHGIRRVHLPRATAALLREHRARLVEAGLDANGWVFPNTTGDLLNASYVHHTLDRLLERAGFAPLGVHFLRHSAATLMLRGGASAPEVARVLGHRDASMINRVYGHALDDSMERIARSLDGVFDTSATQVTPKVTPGGDVGVRGNGTDGRVK